MYDGPTSPSAGVKPNTLRSPHPRPMTQHHAVHPTRKTGLNLPGLPRFHPANFPSADSTISSTPSPGIGTGGPQPLGPSSQRQQSRQASEAQRQLYLHQRDSLNLNQRYKGADGATRPSSPRLHPLGSPGPVTPLELEDGEGYLLAGAGASLSEEAKDQIIESYIQKEAQQHGGQGSQHHRRGESAHLHHRHDLAAQHSHRSTPSR